MHSSSLFDLDVFSQERESFSPNNGFFTYFAFIVFGGHIALDRLKKEVVTKGQRSVGIVDYWGLKEGDKPLPRIKYQQNMQATFEGGMPYYIWFVCTSLLNHVITTYKKLLLISLVIFK